MKICYFCKGKVRRGKIRHIHRWGEKIIVFDDVPAEICQQCGETYLGPEVLDIIERFTLEEREPEQIISVPVFSLADKISA
ncbi:MAG: type II toxin-antitoxin system MqsA family antitoxin [Anaerolineae bacterium]